MNTPKKYFTKPERVLARLLNEQRIPFKARVKIGKYEVDFLIGKLAIELDGHEQLKEKNHYLAKQGYTPWHFRNHEIYENKEYIVNKINGNNSLFTSTG